VEVVLTIQDGQLERSGDSFSLFFIPICQGAEGAEVCDVTGTLSIGDIESTSTSTSDGLRFAISNDLVAAGFDYELTVVSTASPDARRELVGHVPAAPKTIIEVNLGAAEDAAEAQPQLIYHEPFNEGDFGMGLDLESTGTGADGPAGFGVDANGLVHAIDGINHRMIYISASGEVSSTPLPSELADEWIAGMAVAPDGTEYVSTKDAVAVVVDGQLVKMISNESLGVAGALLELRATTDGLYVPSGASWVRALDNSHSPTVGRDRSPLRTASGEMVDVSFQGNDPVISFSGSEQALKVISEPALQGVYLVEKTASGEVVMLLRASSAEEVDNTQLIVVRPDGTFAHRSVRIPPENMVQNGMYVEFAHDTVYLEVGGPDGVSIIAIDIAKLATD
jgi:hypothetical protein